MRQDDYLDKLSDYIIKNAAKGYTLDSLRWALINQKHSRVSVEKSIEIAQKKLAASAPRIEVPKKVEAVQEEAEEPKKKKGFL